MRVGLQLVGICHADESDMTPTLGSHKLRPIWVGQCLHLSKPGYECKAKPVASLFIGNARQRSPTRCRLPQPPPHALWPANLQRDS